MGSCLFWGISLVDSQVNRNISVHMSIKMNPARVQKIMGSLLIGSFWWIGLGLYPRISTLPWSWEMISTQIGQSCCRGCLNVDQDSAISSCTFSERKSCINLLSHHENILWMLLNAVVTNLSSMVAQPGAGVEECVSGKSMCIHTAPFVWMVSMCALYSHEWSFVHEWRELALVHKASLAWVAGTCIHAESSVRANGLCVWAQVASANVSGASCAHVCPSLPWPGFETAVPRYWAAACGLGIRGLMN